jgi:AcrR family transcriptional regulator
MTSPTGVVHRQARRRAGGARLSRDRIVEAAVALVDDAGLDALSLRGVAAALGVSPMALYRYFTTRDELADAVVMALIEREQSTTPMPDGWADALTQIARETRTILFRHPVVLEAIQRRPVLTPSAMERFDRMVGLLVAAGATPPQAVEAYSTVLAYVVGFVSLEFGRQQALATADRTEEEMRARVATQIAALPAEEFPHLVGVADDVASLIDESRFEAGLATVLRGIRSLWSAGAR